MGRAKRLATPQERARLLQASGLVHFDETPVARTPRAEQRTLEIQTAGQPRQQRMLTYNTPSHLVVNKEC